MELYFKKVYTVAYRLTGEEETASEIATLAITQTIKESNGDYGVTANMFKSTILQLLKIFLAKPFIGCNDNLIGIQSSLLKLKPINRALVIWKDVLGYDVSDNMPLTDYSCEDLLRELNCGRKELKKHIIHKNVVEKQKHNAV